MEAIAKKYRDIIGLDIGASSLKLVWLCKDGQSIEVRGAAVRNLPKSDIGGFFKGKTAIIDNIKSCINEIKCPAKKVFLCVSGPNFYAKRLSVVSMPKDELKEAVKWSIKDQVSLEVEKILIDYQVLSDSKNEQGISQLNILAAISEKDFIYSCINAISAAGLVCVGISLSPFVFTSLLEKGLKDKTIAILDIGNLKAELTLFKDGLPQFSRLLPGSSSEFTKAMTTALVSDHGRLELSFEEAEAIKIDIGIPDQEAGMVKEGILAVQLLALIRPVLEKLIGEVRRSFDYFKLQLNLPQPEKLFITGGGSLLKNLDKILAKELTVEVDYLNSLSASGDDRFAFVFTGDAAKKTKAESVFFDVAAATALEEAKGINLFPPELIAEKARRLEKSYFKIAGLVLVLMLFISYIYMSFQIYSLDKQIKIAKANFEAMQEVIILKDKIDRTKTALLRLSPSEYGSAIILKVIASIIQPSVELDSFSYRDNGSIDMVGTVASTRPEAALASFIKYMLEIGIFRNVKIMSLQKDANQPWISRFTIYCEVASKN